VFPCCCSIETNHLLSEFAFSLELDKVQVWSRMSSWPYTYYLLDEWTDLCIPMPLTYMGLCLLAHHGRSQWGGNTVHRLRLAQDDNPFVVTDTTADRTECDFDDYLAKKIEGHESFTRSMWTRTHAAYPIGEDPIYYGLKHVDYWWNFAGSTFEPPRVRRDATEHEAQVSHFWHPSGYFCSWAAGDQTSPLFPDPTPIEHIWYHHDNEDDPQTATGLYIENVGVDWDCPGVMQYKFENPIIFGPDDDPDHTQLYGFTYSDRVYFGDGELDENITPPVPFDKQGVMTGPPFPIRERMKLQITDDFMKLKAVMARRSLLSWAHMGTDSWGQFYYGAFLYTNDFTPDRYTEFSDLTRLEGALVYTEFINNITYLPLINYNYDDVIMDGDDFHIPFVTFTYAPPRSASYPPEGVPYTVYGFGFTASMKVGQQKLLFAARFPEPITFRRYGYYQAEEIRFDFNIFAHRV